MADGLLIRRDAREPLQRRGGNAFEHGGTQVELPDRFEPVEVAEELGRGPLRWDRAQRVQGGERGCVALVEQPGDARALVVAETGDEVLPEPGPRTLTDAPDQALEDRDARQEHLVGDEPGGGPVDQRSGPIVAAPARAAQSQRVSRKRARASSPKSVNPEAVADRRQMPDAGPALEVAIQGNRSPEAKLLAQRLQNGAGHVVGRAGEHAQETDAGEHGREAETIVLAAQLADEIAVGPVQMEEPGELLGHRIAGKAGEASALVAGEVTGRHGARNSELLRRAARTPNTKALRFAKHLSERVAFCNMMCSGVAAARVGSATPW